MSFVDTPINYGTALLDRALDQGDIDIALQEAQVLEDDGRPTAANCIRACARAAQSMLRSPTERERLEMCGPDTVRNEELEL